METKRHGAAEVGIALAMWAGGCAPLPPAPAEPSQLPPARLAPALPQSTASAARPTPTAAAFVSPKCRRKCALGESDCIGEFKFSANQEMLKYIEQGRV